MLDIFCLHLRSILCTSPLYYVLWSWTLRLYQSAYLPARVRHQFGTLAEYWHIDRRKDKAFFFFSALYLHGVAMSHTSHRLLSGSSLSTQHFSLQILFPFTHSVLGMAKDLPLFLAQVTAVFIVVSLYPAHIIKSPSVIYPSWECCFLLGL